MDRVSVNEVKKKLNIEDSNTDLDVTIQNTIDDYELVVRSEYFCDNEIKTLSAEQLKRLRLGMSLYIAGKVMQGEQAKAFTMSGGSVTIGPIRVSGLDGNSGKQAERLAASLIEQAIQILQTLRVESSGILAWRAV